MQFKSSSKGQPKALYALLVSDVYMELKELLARLEEELFKDCRYAFLAIKSFVQSVGQIDEIEAIESVSRIIEACEDAPKIYKDIARAIGNVAYKMEDKETIISAYEAIRIHKNNPEIARDVALAIRAVAYGTEDKEVVKRVSKLLANKKISEFYSS